MEADQPLGEIALSLLISPACVHIEERQSDAIRSFVNCFINGGGGALCSDVCERCWWFPPGVCGLLDRSPHALWGARHIDMTNTEVAEYIDHCILDRRGASNG
jgi:hypothetical protein